MSNHPLPPHRIERTKNRSSRASIVNDVIVIRLAGRLSRAQEHEHIEALLRRMAKSFLHLQAKTLIDPFHEAISHFHPAPEPLGEKYFSPTDSGARSPSLRMEIPTALGRTLDLTLRVGSKFSGFHRANSWTIDVPSSVKPVRLHRALWKAVSITERPHVEKLVQRLNEVTVRVDVRDVRLKFLQSKWGSCSAGRSIILNTALLFVPESILRYVIVHELAHVIHSNHSATFWRTVEGAMPDYQQWRQKLRGYRLPKL